MNRPELLLPAGNLEKLEYAIRYGADAVYLGVVDFSLRAMRKGELITLDNLKEAINKAHSLGAKAYLTLNIFAFNEDIKNLENCIEILSDSNPDAIIATDMGIMRLVQKHMPHIPLHISTQTNTLNYEAVRFWQDMGATRAILARELPIAQVKEIKEKVPDMELEVFVHGAQCVSFSGRCLLSDYMTNGERKANHGNCAQACRWSYKLVEETRPNEFYEIQQNEKGTHILSTKDLNLIRHLGKLVDAGIDSFKIEGRTKSLYYVSAVAKAYKEALDVIMANPNANLDEYFNELLKVGNRGYTTGFYLQDNYPADGYSYDISKGLAGADFLAEVHGVENGYYKILVKNKFYKNTDIELITPKEKLTTQAIEIIDPVKNENLELANTNQELLIKLSNEPQNADYGLFRTVGIKRSDDINTCSPCS